MAHLPFVGQLVRERYFGEAKLLTKFDVSNSGCGRKAAIGVNIS
jgi:hypothetical protein